MPKFIIAERTRPVDVDRPYEIFLSQNEGSDSGEVEVRIRDHEGDEWFLLNIQEDGRVYLQGSVPKHLGFDLDRRGRLKLANDD